MQMFFDIKCGSLRVSLPKFTTAQCHCGQLQRLGHRHVYTLACADTQTDLRMIYIYSPYRTVSEKDEIGKKFSRVYTHTRTAVFWARGSSAAPSVSPSRKGQILHTVKA